MTVTGWSQIQTPVQLLISEKSMFESQGWWKKEDAFIQEVSNLGRWQAFRNHLPSVSWGTKALKGVSGGGLHVGAATVSSNNHPGNGSCSGLVSICLGWVTLSS